MGKLTRNIFKLFIIVFFKFLYVFSQDFRFGWCADPECSVPVAVGITTINYTPSEHFKLAFTPNQEVIVFVRGYGEKKELLGVEINGKKGYVSKNFVRETKSLAKAVVPANLEFLHTPSRSFVYHETSHLHMSTNIPPGEAQNFIQSTVPNSLNPQQSMQAFQHSEVHLESSRHSDNNHFHASSDLYIAKNADSRNHFPQSGGANYQAVHIDSSSHSHFGSESIMASSFVPKAEMISNSDNNNQQFKTTRFSESQQQNPTSQFHSPPNFVQETINSNMRQNFDPQSNNLFHSQGFDQQSNILHHTQSPPTTPHLTNQNQMFTQSNTPPMNNFDKGYDETMALLQNQGYNTAGEFTNQLANQHHSEKQVTSFQNANSENLGWNTAGHHHLEKQTASVQNSQSENLGLNTANHHHLEKQATSFRNVQSENLGWNTPNHHQEKQTSSFQNINSEHLGGNSDFHSKKPLMQPEHTPSLVNNAQTNLNSPFTNLKLDELQEIVDSLFTEDISVTPSEPIVNQEASIFQFNERLAAKIDKMSNLAKTIESKFETQSKVVDIDESTDDDDDEDYIDYENIHASNSMKTTILDKTEKDLNLGIKIEQSNTVDEPLVTKSGISQTIYDVLSESKSEPLNVATSTTANVLKDGMNEISSDDTVIKSDTFEKKSESNNEDTFEKKVATILEINEESSNISSTDDVSPNNSTSEELKDAEIVSENKETDSDIDADLILEDEDIIIDNDEKANTNDAGGLENDIDEKANQSDSIDLSSDSSKIDSLLNVSEIKETENLLNAYQTRHLKDVESDADSFPSTEESEQSGSNYEFDIYIAVENTFVAMRTFVDALLPWIPEPLYTMLMDLEREGISPKVTVFTAISAIPCIILIVSLVLIKGKSKENKLNARLTILERNFYNLNAEKVILEEKLEKAELELQILRGVIEEEKILSFKLKTEIESVKQQLEGTTLELEKNVDEVETMKGREHEYVELIRDHEKEHLRLLEQKGEVENKVLEFEDTLVILRDSLQEKEVELQKLLAEKSEYRQANEVYEEKVNLLQKNCNQLLQEAEVWNLRVNELNEKLSQESLKNEEAEKCLQEKIIEIESLSEAVQLFKTFEEIGADNDECKTSEDKLKYLKNSTHNLMKLQKQEEENRLLSERLTEAKNRLLDIEVSILDVKSENDKLKVNYNQALQDRTEAQTKLEVLTNYFKDKEIQLQKQLGVQEAVRQKTEEDASSAERRICLIEQENSSYKYQVASMKQEIEETERNLKSQISLQEKKAHENWLAARTAERKLEDTKQEVMQLRQRLTLLEREQENWANSARDEIIRPVPKRVGNMNDDSINTQDSNSSLELRSNVFPPPPPMMLPPDRPLPPLPPLPPFLRPFEPPPSFESIPPFQPLPWNMPPPDSNSDFRMTPSDYGRGRESTPPRGRNSALVDGDLGPRQSSPITDMKNSRNSTPPHLLPDFHDIPPHPSRPFYPPPPMGPRTRYPGPPRFPPTNFRRDYPGQRRIDNQEENSSSYGSQNAPVPPDDWHNSNTRV